MEANIDFWKFVNHTVHFKSEFNLSTDVDCQLITK